MGTRTWVIVLVLLFLVILGLSWALIAIPAPASPVTGTFTSPAATSTQPLSGRVIVKLPISGSAVPKVFTVAGSAPGPWYFEASFPIKVVDADNNFIGQGIAQAQGDWMTVDSVDFIATVTVTGYTGPATIVLLRDNPSGMPENDDSISVPIVVQ